MVLPEWQPGAAAAYPDFLPVLCIILCTEFQILERLPTPSDTEQLWISTCQHTSTILRTFGLIGHSLESKKPLCQTTSLLQPS